MFEYICWIEKFNLMIQFLRIWEGKVFNAWDFFVVMIHRCLRSGGLGDVKWKAQNFNWILTMKQFNFFTDLINSLVSKN